LHRFPTVDFHAGSQRLAVGTADGAVVVYDAKTGTRLYVLEGHRRALSACAFAPDGRRLVSASVAEGSARVWKVGGALASFFHPGAPGEALRTFPFLIPDAGACRREWEGVRAC
jgi:WD40 repeat protein